MNDIIAKAFSIRNTIARKANEELQDTGVLSDAFIELLGDNEEHVDLRIYSLEDGNVIGKTGGPSRQRGSGFAEGLHFPPISNTGVFKYQSSPLSPESGELPDPPSFLESLQPGSREKTIGGYDGGTSVGFDGFWDKSDFTSVMDQLAAARASSESAEHRTPDESYIAIGNRLWIVRPYGAGGTRKGVYYKYVIEGEGIKVYFHHSAKGSIQPVRVQYGFEAVIGKNPFQVHREFLAWLASIGFTVTGEKISRADLQVTTQRPTEDYLNLIEADKGSRLIMAPRTDKLIRRRGRETAIETYTAGSHTSIQICIYNKKQELVSKRDELKTRLLAKEFFDMNLPENCGCGANFLWEHLTRIEFRIGRDRLKKMDINTMQDLEEKQESLVAYLTFCFFRILESPKIRGHENTQEIHPIWREVMDLFAKHFSTDGEKKEITRGRGKCIRCTCDELVSQAMGCFSTAVALVEGTSSTVESAVNYVVGKVREYADRLQSRALDRAKELHIVRGHDPSMFDPDMAMEYDRESWILELRSHEQPLGVPF